MTKVRGTALFLASCALGTLVGAAPATAAFAGPPGCRHDTTQFYQHTSGSLHALGEGNCTSYAYRVLYAEVKQSLAWRPDPVAVRGSDPGTQKYYWAHAHGCDNGNYGTYYGRSFFYGYSDYDDTSTKTFQAC